MTTISHILSSSLIAYTLTSKTPPPNIDWVLLYVSILPAALIDIDHIYYISKKRDYFIENKTKGVLHEARSIFHELAGVMIMGIFALFLSFFSPMHAVAFFVSFLIHITEDIIMGISIPLSPVDKTLIRPFMFTFKHKTVVDIVVGGGSALAWILYLNVFHF